MTTETATFLLRFLEGMDPAQSVASSREAPLTREGIFTPFTQRGSGVL